MADLTIAQKLRARAATGLTVSIEMSPDEARALARRIEAHEAMAPTLIRLREDLLAVRATLLSQDAALRAASAALHLRDADLTEMKGQMESLEIARLDAEAARARGSAVFRMSMLALLALTAAGVISMALSSGLARALGVA